MFCFKISKSQTVRGHDYQILFPGRIYYNILSSTKFEVECRKDLRHLLVKVRRYLNTN